MDYRDVEIGATKDYFWFEAKVGLIDLLFRKLEGQETLKILNVGAGTGNDIAVLNRFGQVYVVDIDERVLDLIPNELVAEKKVCDVCAMPYPDGFFDRVAAFDLLEHIENDHKAIQEIHRVLRKDGALIFTVPAFPFLYSAHDKALHHFRRYNVKMLEARLRQFKRFKIGYWVFSLFLPIAAFRLMKRNDPIPKVSIFPIPRIVDRIFFSLLKIENWLIAHHFHLPFGVTLYGIFQKR